MKFEIPGKYVPLRDDGRELREKLEGLLRDAAPGAVVEIAFHEVEAIGASATDEFLGKLLTARRAGDVPDVAFVLTGLNDDTAFEVNVVLRNRGAVAASLSDSTPKLLGGDDYLKQTFERGAEAGEFDTTKLAEALDVTPQNLNNRLKRLVTDGALLRFRDPSAGGKKFLYKVPMPA